jgi:hypothetical protein
VALDRRERDAFSSAMLDRLEQSPDMATVRHTVQVTSFGGSGTTALYDHLIAAGIDVPQTVGQFPFKHQRVPPARGDVPDGFRVVYLFGDPRNAVVSVFRREYQGGHYRGMRLQEPTPDVERRLTDLDHFLDGGVDEFEIADHFDRWYLRDARSYPVMFLRYEDLPTAWPLVRDFVGLPTDDPCLELWERKSEWQRLPEPAQMRLEEMYGEFARRLAALPAVHVR